jgi:hypothetical protein
MPINPTPTSPILITTYILLFYRFLQFDPYSEIPIAVRFRGFFAKSLSNSLRLFSVVARITLIIHNQNRCSRWYMGLHRKPLHRCSRKGGHPDDLPGLVFAGGDCGRVAQTLVRDRDRTHAGQQLRNELGGHVTRGHLKEERRPKLA